MFKWSFCCAVLLTSIVLIASQAAEAAITWNPTGSGTARDWDTNNTGAWQLPLGTKFQVGDDVNFIRAQDLTGGTVFIGTGVTPADVSPSSVNLYGGYGATWTFTGGDILGGSTTVSVTQDNTGRFDRDASYSFGGGASIEPFVGTGHLRYRPPTATGNLQFGSGPIGIGNTSTSTNPGIFYFEPGVAGATLTNDFTINMSGGTITGNANADFSGTVTMDASSGTLTVTGQDIFSGLTIDVTSNPTINIPIHYSSGGRGKFDGQIDGGGTNDVTIQTGTTGSPTDYYGELTSTGGWNVKDVYFTGTRGIAIVPSSATFFSGVASNGGKVYVQEGLVAPSTGNNANGTSKSGTYDVSVDHVVNAQLRAATINVNSGATVFGTGTLYTNTVEVMSGATVSPGQSAGILNVDGAINFQSGSQLTIEITGAGGVAGTDFDQLVVTGNATGLALTDLVVEIDPGLTLGDLVGDTLTILTSSNDLTGLEFNSVTITGVPLIADVTFGNQSITLSNFDTPPVPEPSSFLLLAMGGMVMAARRRRRRR